MASSGPEKKKKAKKSQASLAKKKSAAKSSKKVKKTKVAQASKPRSRPVSKKPFEVAAERNPEEQLKQLRQDQGYMPVGDHLEELRWRIVRSVIWIVAFAGISLLFYDFIWQFVMGPILPLIEEGKNQDVLVKIIVNRLGDYFLIKFKIALMVGFIMALPIILFEFWGFVLPALDKAFRRWGNGLLIAAIFLFWGGVATARFYLWPLVTKFLIFEWLPPPLEYATAAGVQLITPEVHLTIGDYLSFFLGFHFGFGISFELPIISMILALMGILYSSFFWQYWRFAIVIIAVLSAMITPPDAFSMVAVMLPLVLLYFISAFLVWLIERRRRKYES